MQRTTPKFLWVSEEGEKQLTYEHKEKATGIVFINITIDIDIPLINLRMS